MRGALALAGALAPLPATAGAWTLENGRTQIIFSGTSLEARSRFDQQGSARRAGRFSKQETAINAEHGLWDGLTLLAGVAGRTAIFAPPVGSDSSEAWRSMAGSATAGLRARLWTDGETVLSVQATASGGRDQLLPRGLFPSDPPIELETRLLVGHGLSIGGMPAFAGIEAGYRWRGGRASELVLDATLGLRPFPQVLLLLQSFNAVAMGGDRRSGGGMRRHKLQPSIVWDVTDGWSVQVGAFMSPAGRETPQERGLVAAVWRRF